LILFFKKVTFIEKEEILLLNRKHKTFLLDTKIQKVQKHVENCPFPTPACQPPSPSIKVFKVPGLCASH
jgi:hypothetical protein